MSLVCAEENDTALTSDSINIEAKDISMFYKNGTRLSTVLSDTNDTPVSNASLIITINGQDYKRTTNDEGKASLAINLIPGSYIANINFLGNEKYSPLNKTLNVNVLSTIAANDLVKYYKNSSQYYATLFDGTGNVLTNTDVIFNINGVFYTRQTNNNGVAKLNINLNPGDYILTAYNTKDGCSFSNKIKVLSTINSSDLVKIFRDNHQYWVTARNFNGNPLSYQDVEFNVNGVFYTRQTNKYGNSKLNINLEPGNYIITAYNKITGEAIGNHITVYANSDTKLTTKNYVFKSNDDDTIQATLTNKLNYGVEGETIN
ncbi:MAG: cysteine protease, partial [Methanobrevibacter sp.]|nr:cysteine protease [Methanobrevibacter sp.]